MSSPSPSAGRAADVSPKRWAYREAASVLTAFDPARLRPGAGAGEPGGALLELIDDCATVGDPTRRRWTLKPAVRTAALRRLSGGAAALEALEANGDPAHDPVEATVRDYLQGTAAPLEAQDLEQLSHTLQALRRLGEIPGLDDLPTLSEAMQVYARRQLFSPLESLVGERFHGRRAELAELRLHVGALEATTVSTYVRGATRRLNPFAADTEPPLMLHGPPGIGKSTLLAKFVLDHAREGDARIPFVYVDFERPTLSALEPATLLAEAARQLAIQRPAAASRLEEVAHAAALEARRQREAGSELADLDDVRPARVTVQRSLTHRARLQAREAEAALIRRLVSALRSGVPAGAAQEPPLLIALDSFEQAQYRSSPHLRRLWDMFDAFQQAYPRVRVVVSGRAPVEQLAINRRPAKELKLEEFDRSASVAFLIDEGVEDPQLAELIAARFGGNALSLKLAASNARRAEPGIDWMKDVRRRRWLLFRIEESQIQTRLYERLLGSVEDPRIAALAHPGLILRRITPAVIREVMAGPCGVDVPDMARAQELFEAFARQVDLVMPAGDALAHRPDVRRDMLPLVERARPDTVEALDRAAVAYYAEQAGPQARAEEIYHRLRLGEPPRDVDQRWEPGVERLLWGAEREVPDHRAQAYLAAKLRDARATPEALAEADDADWEVLTAREVDDLLDQGADGPDPRPNARAALELMAARTGWSPGSPLYRLKAEALEALGEQASAEETVQAGIAAIEDRRVPATTAVASTLLDLLLLGARLVRSHGGSSAIADHQLEEAERLATRLGRGLDALGTLLYRLQLQRSSGEELEGARALRARATAGFLEADDDELRRQPALTRALAVELGPEDADVVLRAIDVLGLDADDPRALERLERAVAALAGADPAFASWLEDSAARRGIASGPQPRIAGLLAHAARSGRLEDLARVLVARSRDGSELRAAVIDMLSESQASQWLT